jgi:hypothetical protein
MYYVLQNKLGNNIIEYAVLTATSMYFTGGEYGLWESDWSVATTDVVEDATKFYSEQEAFNMLAWIDDLPEDVWHPVKLEATL